MLGATKLELAMRSDPEKLWRTSGACHSHAWIKANTTLYICENKKIETAFQANRELWICQFENLLSKGFVVDKSINWETSALLVQSEHLDPG